MKQTLRKTYRFLISPKLAVIVVLLVTFASIMGALLDSDWILKIYPGVSSQVIFSSKWFLVLNMLLLICIGFCSIHQIKLARIRWLQDSLHKPYTRSRLLGSPVFHIGLTVLLLGIMIDVFAGFTGYFFIRPGQVIADRVENYRDIKQGPLFVKSVKQFELELNQIYLEPSQSRVKSSATISILQNGLLQRMSKLDSNQQEQVGLYAISKDSYGYYAFYQIKATDRIILDHALGLDTVIQNQSTEYSSTDFNHIKEGYQISIAYYPDLQKAEKPYRNRTYARGNEAVHLIAKQNQSIVYDGIVQRGQEITMKNGQAFVFRGVVPYLKVRVQWLLGTYVISSGFIVFTIGLMLYYFLPVKPEKAIIKEKSVEKNKKVQGSDNCD